MPLRSRFVTRAIACCATLLIAACYERSPVAATIEPARAPIVPASGFNVCWDSIESPRTLARNAEADVIVTVRNCGDTVWPDVQMADIENVSGREAVRLGFRWKDSSGRIVQDFAKRSDLPWPLFPGKGVELATVVHAPATPGRYTLEFDLVQELVTWFGDHTGNRGSVVVEVL